MRTDRIIIYPSDRQIPLVTDTLNRILSDYPEAFAGRKIAGFGEVLTDGITHADEVTPEQNDRFKGPGSDGISFNDLRVRLAFEATLATMRLIICDKECGSMTIDNQTILKRFIAELNKTLKKKIPNLVIAEDDPDLLRAMSLTLSPRKLEKSGKFSQTAIDSIGKAIDQVTKTVLPRITPDSLLPIYSRAIGQIAPRYGIDPNNLAKNIPIVSEPISKT